MALSAAAPLAPPGMVRVGHFLWRVLVMNHSKCCLIAFIDQRTAKVDRVMIASSFPVTQAGRQYSQALLLGTSDASSMISAIATPQWDWIMPLMERLMER